MKTMNVRHDAPIEVTVKAGKKVLAKDTVEAKLLDAHISIQSWMYGGISGNVNWHDNEGNSLSKAPRVTLRLLDPTFELAEGENCMCAECIETYGGVE